MKSEELLHDISHLCLSRFLLLTVSLDGVRRQIAFAVLFFIYSTSPTELNYLDT